MSRWLPAVGFALALLLAFPHPIGGVVLDLGWIAGWLAPALLLRALAGHAPRRAARDAFLAALIAHAGVMHWIYVATVVYGHAPAPVGVAATFGIALYPAVFFAVFGATWAALARAGLATPFAAAALWIALEHARSFVATGLPWALLGYTQHRNPALLAWAPWAGVWGPGFVVALGGASLALWRASPRASRAGLAAVATLLVGGALLAALEPAESGDTVRVGVVQGNVDQNVKWSPAFAERTLADYEALTRRAAADGAQIVVWPETAVPGSPDWDEGIAQRLAALAIETQAALVVGAVGVEPRRGGGARYFDSAFVYAPDGTLLDRYDKTHLVPFGEYVPFRDLLGRFISAIARGVATTDVSQGRAVRAIAVPLRDGGALTAGVPICYELIFPDEVRGFVQSIAGQTGAELLLAITNDAWYGRTGAPYQFLAMTAMRSAENRVWTARAANTGVSALIDHRGRVRMQTGLFEQTLLVGDVPRRPAPAGGSFYTRHGDWLPAACWLASAGLGAAAWRRRGGLA
jgi:apolipoprotein N-acyltransferase